MSDNFVFRLMLVVIAVVIVFALVVQHNRNKENSQGQGQAQGAAPQAASHPIHREGFENTISPAVASPRQIPTNNEQAPNRMMVAPPPAPALQNLVDPAPFESLDTEMYRALDYKPEANSAPQASAFPKDRITKADLLPADAANTKWAQVNPAGQGDLEGVNLLDAGWNFGIDTQGQTLKNPNLQLRSEFANPRADTGPWNMSTIENDVSRRYFEIGEP